MKMILRSDADSRRLAQLAPVGDKHQAPHVEFDEMPTETVPRDGEQASVAFERPEWIGKKASGAHGERAEGARSPTKEGEYATIANEPF